MSDAATASVSDASKPSWFWVLIVNLPYLALYAFTIWLVAVTDSDPVTAAIYWQWFVPAVGVVATIGGWRSPAAANKAAYLLKQVLHWGTLLLVINLLFLKSMQDFLNAESHGFVVAYMLGLAAILSGIYLDWKMAVFGAFVIGSAVGIGYLDDNAMLLTVIGVAIAGIAVTLAIRRRGSD